MIDLQQTSELLKLLADPNRLRLLLLLEAEELTVAELAAITLLAQPRVSTHLARLKKTELVRDRKAGVQCYYRMVSPSNATLQSVWKAVQAGVDDAQAAADRDRLAAVTAARAREQGWADSVAGDMERHYSPGRTWEATARATMFLLDLGDVVDVASGDGVLAELVARRARSVTCVDASNAVVEAANRRLAPFPNARAIRGDMHDLPLTDASVDCVLLMHALTYTTEPQQALIDAARVCRPGGQILVATLNAHGHENVVSPYDHRNLGFAPAQLRDRMVQASLDVTFCDVVSAESRPPHFEIVICHARKPS